MKQDKPIYCTVSKCHPDTNIISHFGKTGVQLTIFSNHLVLSKHIYDCQNSRWLQLYMAKKILSFIRKYKQICFMCPHYTIKLANA